MQIILLARSYNDLDCRLPLLREFAARPKVSASIIIIPTITSSGLSVKHSLPERMGFTCEHAVTKLLPGFLGKFYVWASQLLEQSSIPALRYKVWAWVWSGLYSYLSRSATFRRSFLDLIDDNAVIIIDDILATPSRSFIVPLIADHRSARLLCLSHGQDTYLNLWHDKPRSLLVTQKQGHRLKIHTPSDNDSRILVARYPDAEVITIGNTRFDSQWVLDHQERLLCEDSALKPYEGTKIAFMMSKMEYGLEASEVISLINQAASRNNTRIVLKPHTRGMSLREYENQLHENVIVGESLTSSEIIDWADIVFFTGSSIIFEAMIKKKRVLYLAALQKYQTIFDQLPEIAIFRSGTDIGSAINRLERETYDHEIIEDFVAGNTHNRIPGGCVCAAFADRVLSELHH